MGLEPKFHEGMTFGEWGNRKQKWQWEKLVYAKKHKNAPRIHKNEKLKLTQMTPRAKMSWCWWLRKSWTYKPTSATNFVTSSLQNYEIISIIFAFFSKISAILTPKTMKFGHKDYFYTKKWHKKKSEKFQFLGIFLGVLFIHKFKNDVFVHDFLSH